MCPGQNNEKNSLECGFDPLKKEEYAVYDALLEANQDMLLTRELEICGMFMGIDIKDHIIIGKEGYISIKKWKLNKTNKTK